MPMDQHRSGPAASQPPRGGSWLRVFLATAVVVIIILIAVVAPRARDYEKFISGFWSGDPAFLNESGLSQMHLYISPGERSGGKWRRQGYLLMVDSSGGMVSNQGIEIIYDGAVGRWKSVIKSNFSGKAQETYQIPAVTIDYDTQGVLPSEELRMGLNIAEGTLAIYTDEKIYAFFVKDNEASVSANAEYRAGGLSGE
jgi:hypothetical protein